MSSIALLASAALFAAAFLLWGRFCKETGIPAGAIDGERFWQASAQGMRALDVPHRETHDPYRTVGDLLDALPDIQEPARRVKALYQLQGALGLDDKILEYDVASLVGTMVMDRTVVRVKTIEPGALIDRTTMCPLGSGSCVRQPLGVIAYDADGRVLAKAKVLT